MNESQRAAAGLMTNLSGFIITANLSMLAILAASFVFVAGQEGMITVPYYFLSFVAFVSFVSSIFLGGKAITTTATKLSESAWTIKTASTKFNFQALFSLLGIICFLVASVFFVGEKKGKDEDGIVTELRKINQTLSAISFTRSYINSPVDDKIYIKLDELEKVIFNESEKHFCSIMDTDEDGGSLSCPKGSYFAGAVKHPSKNGTLDKILCCPR